MKHPLRFDGALRCLRTPFGICFQVPGHDDEIFQGNAWKSLGRALNKKRLELEFEAL